MRVFGRLIFLVAVAAIMFPGKGGAQSHLTLDSLMGKWCGDQSNYSFTPHKLVVDFHSGERRVIGLEKINVSPDSIEIIWVKRDGGKNTIFEQFTGSTMVQRKNDGGDNGPERHFHRC